MSQYPTVFHPCVLPHPRKDPNTQTPKQHSFLPVEIIRPWLHTTQWFSKPSIPDKYAFFIIHLHIKLAVVL